ncbi:MAG: hypothetical protein RLZ56_1332 [Bacteroidota bacterium]
MRSLSTFLCCIFLFVHISLKAQLPNEYQEDTVLAVKQVINNMFLAMKNSDSNLLKSCFSTNVVFQTVVNKAGLVSVKEESVQDFINSIGKQPLGSLDEQIQFGSLLINRDLAAVWTPYQFYYKQKYSHSGVNSFQLVKFKEGWKIQYIIDTRYR